MCSVKGLGRGGAAGLQTHGCNYDLEVAGRCYHQGPCRPSIILAMIIHRAALTRGMQIHRNTFKFDGTLMQWRIKCKGKDGLWLEGNHKLQTSSLLYRNPPAAVDVLSLVDVILGDGAVGDLLKVGHRQVLHGGNEVLVVGGKKDGRPLAHDP
jgi:hypothetical protein